MIDEVNDVYLMLNVSIMWMMSLLNVCKVIPVVMLSIL